jgi:hypothetical protein
VRLPERFCVCFLLLTFCAAPFTVKAQERCGAVEYTELLRSKNLLLENSYTFEKWLQQKQSLKQRQNKSQRTQAAYQIPVVVHVIHNGEAVGSGTNISDAQILSQISVLNKDYKRLNADAASTPPEFQPLAGLFDVEFVLAKQDPEGLATTGIQRVQGSKTSWTMNDNYTLKAQSYWPAEDYLNIWVCNETDFLGYSQFPVSGLPGLENSSTNRLTDGVVVAYRAFGSIDDGPFNLQNNFKKGRTTTHEVGHFFGLKHIWGDDNGDCSGSDYVNDTPNQSGSTSGCPAHPRVTCTDVTAMFQNFLDYTNDECMNLFTLGQVGRMEIIIENSPRRASLTSSHGLQEPAPLTNDLGIKDIIAPQTGQCSAPFVPIIEVKNYGNNSITSARVLLKKDGVNTETKDFTFSTALSPLESSTVSFAPISLANGNHNVSFQILLTNSVTDPNPSNNLLDQDVFVPGSIAVPFIEMFNTIPNWSIVNPDQNITWDLATTPEGGTNTAMKMEFYSYEDHLGEYDVLITPAFDLANAPAALLKFDVAYARFQSSNDGLKVVLLNNCSMDISSGVVVYDKWGASLATTSSTSSNFVPANDQWRNEAVDLSAYIGQPNVQIAFVGLNDWGNNLYIDNVSLTTTPVHDVTLVNVLQPSAVTCDNQITPTLLIRNEGTLINTVKVTTTINGTVSTQTATDLNLNGNEEMELQLPPIVLPDGENRVKFTLSDPDGQPDFDPGDNTKEVVSVVNKAEDNIPLRQNFESQFDDQWTTANPTEGMMWESVAINGNKALYVNAFTNTAIGDQSWFVSPVLDFSTAEEASVYYELSYATRENAVDYFYILASKDCGNVYSDTIFASSGALLANGRTSASSWQPNGESDWTPDLRTLESLAGEPNVRIAFVFKNGNGNNLYIDNIEFYVSNSPIRLNETFSVYPSPTIDGNAVISFNLLEKGPVTVEVIDNMGKTLITETLPDILNQTFPFSLTGKAAGVYIVRVTAGESVYYKRLIVVN